MLGGMKTTLFCLLTLSSTLFSQEVPHYGSWGVDLAAQDKTVLPGGDFFRFVNGRWLEGAEIPPDTVAVSVSQKVRDIVESRLHTLLEEADGKVGTFYRSFMNEQLIEELGAKPIQQQLLAIKQAKERSDITALMGLQTQDFYGSIFGLAVDIDQNDPTKYTLYLAPAPLGLPSSDYYLKDGYKDKKASYVAYVARMMGETMAVQVVAFETELARAQEEASAGEVKAIDLSPFYKAAGFTTAPKAVVAGSCQKIAEVYAKTPLEILKAWQIFSVINNASFYLSKSYSDSYFQMYQKELSGQMVQKERYKRAILAVSGGDYSTGERLQCFGNMGWAVGKLYADRYFPKQVKLDLEAITDNLKRAFSERIKKIDWMSPSTKTEALRKVEKVAIEVGYPDTFRDYSEVEIKEDDLVGNVLRLAQADWNYQKALLTKPVDKNEEWKITPQTVNALNSPFGQLIFPAAILLPPMYDPDADLAVNYGAAGAFIAHEIIHGFDDQGRLYNAEGKRYNWWQDADAKEFEKRAHMLVEQYSSYEVLPGFYVDGRLTLSENIADLGGLQVALDAYLLALDGKTAPMFSGYTGVQRLFLSWGQLWRGKMRSDALKRYIVSDPHAPRTARVNGIVRNIDAWYECFSVQPQDGLYLAPDKRVRLW